MQEIAVPPAARPAKDRQVPREMDPRRHGGRSAMLRSGRPDMSDATALRYDRTAFSPTWLSRSPALLSAPLVLSKDQRPTTAAQLPRTPQRDFPGGQFAAATGPPGRPASRISYPYPGGRSGRGRDHHRGCAARDAPACCMTAGNDIHGGPDRRGDQASNARWTGGLTRRPSAAGIRNVARHPGHGGAAASTPRRRQYCRWSPPGAPTSARSRAVICRLPYFVRHAAHRAGLVMGSAGRIPGTGEQAEKGGRHAAT